MEVDYEAENKKNNAFRFLLVVSDNYMVFFAVPDHPCTPGISVSHVENAAEFVRWDWT